MENGQTIGTPKELFEGESRVAMTPHSATQLQKLGYRCAIQAGAGQSAGFSDEAYQNAGVDVIETAAGLWETADIVAKVREPLTDELAYLAKGKTVSWARKTVAGSTKVTPSSMASARARA